MDNKTPIFSTEGLYGSSNIVIAFVCLIIGAVVVIYCFPTYSIVYWLLLILINIPYTKTTNMKKSYVKLYEDHISGYSISSKIMSNNACEFNLRYSDITNVSAQNNMVEIYFSGGSYLVQAKDVESKVVEMINTYRTQS